MQLISFAGSGLGIYANRGLAFSAAKINEDNAVLGTFIKPQCGHLLLFALQVQAGDCQRDQRHKGGIFFNRGQLQDGVLGNRGQLRM